MESIIDNILEKHEQFDQHFEEIDISFDEGNQYIVIDNTDPFDI